MLLPCILYEGTKGVMVMKVPDSIDKTIENSLGKVSGTAGDLLDAALTYAGRNVIKKYKFSQADDDFQLSAYKQAQQHALQLQEIKNKKIEEYYGDFIDKNIRSIAEKTLCLSRMIEEDQRLLPNVGFVGATLEDAKYVDATYMQEMFAQLLAASVNKDKAYLVHPAFVSTIKQLSPLDAHNLSLFKEKTSYPIVKYVVYCPRSGDARVENHITEPIFLANEHEVSLERQAASISILDRLGLLKYDYMGFEKASDYEPFNQTYIAQMLRETNPEAKEIKLYKGQVFLTMYGKDFLEICMP